MGVRAGQAGWALLEERFVRHTKGSTSFHRAAGLGNTPSISRMNT